MWARCDHVYAFGSDTPDDNGAYDTVEVGVGKVVSMDANTDSLVFKLKDEIEIKIDPLRLPPEAGLQGPQFFGGLVPHLGTVASHQSLGGHL
jgi:hypothetical protein